MNRQEFEALRNLQGKRIASDIRFSARRETSPNLVTEELSVENTLGWDVVLNGTFKPGIPSVTFNFHIRGVGPICRVDVNGTIHPGAGRTHKHELRREDDPRGNLPVAGSRPDLDGKSVKEVWNVLCMQVNITHDGQFIDPEGGGT